MEKSKKKIVYGIICGVAALICVFLVVKYIQYRSMIQDSQDQIEELKVSTVPDEESDETVYRDFDALREVNPDIYAWIVVEGTGVDYPILRAEEDNWYLTYNIDGTKGYPGCIYTNVCNSMDFSDYITLVYGHNMKSGEMFGSLHNFDDEEFFTSHDHFTIEIENDIKEYEIYATVNYNDKLIPAYYDVDTVEGRDEFLESILEYEDDELTHIREGVVIGDEDKLVVLSVCINNQDDRRFLVIGKLKN